MHKIQFLYLNPLISSQKWHRTFHTVTHSSWCSEILWINAEPPACPVSGPCHSGFLKDLPVRTIIITNYSWHLCLALIFKAAREVWKGHRNEKPQDYIICLSDFFFFFNIKQMSQGAIWLSGTWTNPILPMFNHIYFNY